MLSISVITLFPEMFQAMTHSIVGRAQEQDLLDLSYLYLRDFAINDYGQVDDTPYGGEAGMVIRPEPLADAIESVKKPGCKVIYTTPQGKVFDQDMAKEFAQHEDLIIICGHYKGIDERICEEYVDYEVSIGDYVLTGGELPAMIMIDAVSRMIPGVLGNEDSGKTDSFYENRLGWPVYTRPKEFHGREVPKVLLSGHHKKIEAWRRTESEKRTEERRPDLNK